MQDSSRRNTRGGLPSGMHGDSQEISDLRRILRQKNQFVIDTLSQVRTPLEGIEGLAELVLRSSDRTRRKENLHLILEATGQLRRLVNDLLHLEQLETGDIAYEIVHFDMGDLISEVTPLGEAMLVGKKGVKLECALAPDLPAVHGDVRKIREVLLNFLRNAVQFTLKGRIRITAHLVDDHVRVDVEDTGIGISEDERAIVWEQFHRAGGDISPVYEGAGLGLSINKKIIESHHGHIGLESEIGRGSTFSFTIPTCRSGLLPAMKRRGPEGEELAEEVDYQSALRRHQAISVLEEKGKSGELVAPKPKKPVRREARYRRLAAGKGERILVVDDSPVSIEILRELLEGHGYQVSLAPDGPTAVDCLKREPPDVVITELWLPRMSGFDLVKAAREREETALTPIILLTARRDREDIAYGLNLGADDYLKKPFDHAELLARIGVLLRLKRAREDLVSLNLGLEEEVEKRTTELAAAKERLYLSEKLKSLGQLTAGIAHEMNNPLSFAFSNVELVKERLLARDALRGIRRIRPLIRAAVGEGTRVTLEETFLSELAENVLYRQDVAHYREEATSLTGRVRAGRFLEFLSYVESSAAGRGGGSGDLFEHAVHLLTSAEEGMHRVREIVRDLSAFSHPGSEETTAVDFSQSVNRVLTILGPALKEKNIRVTRSLRLRQPVTAVTGRVDQVLMNLLQNAVQASPSGSTIRLRTRRDGDFGRLEVEDRGPGIPDEVSSRIFDPFFTTKQVGEGTGLGLSICYRIVDGLDGEITFSSRKGKGTTFVVRLPIAAG